MGLFDKSYCPLCGNQLVFGNKSRKKYNGENLCGDCWSKLFVNDYMDKVDDMKLEELKEIVKTLSKPAPIEIANKINGVSNDIQRVPGYLEVDTQNKTWRIPGLMGTPMIPYKDLINYELLEDGSSITKGGASIGRAAVGGLLLGPAGFIVGGVTGKRKNVDYCTYMQIKITTKNTSVPVRYIKLISSKTKKNSIAYKQACKNAQSILSLFDIVSSDNATEVVPQQRSGTEAAEIKAYKELLDSGAITKEEYEAKKKQLLGL